VLKLGKKAFLPGLIINYCIGFFAMLAYGRLSDKIGRRVVYMWGAAVCGVLAFPFFWMMDKSAAERGVGLGGYHPDGATRPLRHVRAAGQLLRRAVSGEGPL